MVPVATGQGSCALWRSLTSVAPKPIIVIEQATSSYSFRFSELSQPSEVLPLSSPLKEELRYDSIDPLGTFS